jgi:hypothetical protein
MGGNVRDQFAPAVPVDRKPHHIADVACHPSGVRSQSWTVPSEFATAREVPSVSTTIP